MKVYITADMEGCSGVVHREHTSARGIDYEIARRLMTREVNSAVQGALDAGATEVVVSDAHGSFRNIPIEELHEEALLITGGPREWGQMEGIDETFDAAVFIGYHARHASRGVLNHTTNGQAVFRVTLNGRETGEIGMNAALAASLGVPTILVAGDVTATVEAKAFIKGVHTVAVMESLGRYAAKCIHPVKARGMIRDSVTTALQQRQAVQLFLPNAPYTFDVTFKDTGSLDAVCLIPQVEIIDEVTCRVRRDSYPQAYKAYNAIINAWVRSWGAWIRD